MGEEQAGTGLTAEEASYYRAVEDHFARLRRTPFLFSSKDFALLREWWSGGVPLAAVLAGIGEVFERRAEADGDPVSSLSYCRHAVNRHAKRLATAGAELAHAERPEVGEILAGLVAAVREAAVRWQATPVLADEITRLAAALESLSPGSDPSALDQALVRLEVGLVDALAAALPEQERRQVEAAVAEALAGSNLDAAVRRRTERALRLRCVREAVGLPRLALDDDGA